ncbi:hypothetical protein L2E82_38931 [Cichorium intybus]|uniref:Uncharacterized protein n=1 Tax=Cichorium intybus TaxID=13427 RepID=A0ACB9AG97_CICIN|nr:hypothetical protein L2E82_38931 [Cichorium intybus]
MQSIPQAFNNVEESNDLDNEEIDSDENDSNQFDDTDDDLLEDESSEEDVPEIETPVIFIGEEDVKSSNDSVVRETMPEEQLLEATHANLIGSPKTAETPFDSPKDASGSNPGTNSVSTEPKFVVEAQSPNNDSSSRRFRLDPVSKLENINPPLNNLLDQESLKENKKGSEPRLGLDAIKKDSIPEDLNGVSANLNFLLSRSTPIKEKLDKISNTKPQIQPNGDHEVFGDQENFEKKSTPIFERRITRSQKRQAWKQQGWIQDQSSEIFSSTESSISSGIMNKVEEIGKKCGFGKHKGKGSGKRQGGLKGVNDGKK